MRRVFVGLIVSAVVLGVWSTSALARIEPCLLTPADIEDAIGIEMEQEFDGLAECSYVSAPGDAGEAGSVGILLSENESKKEAKAVYKDQRFLVTQAERVRGVGNAAFYTASIGDMVVFRKGATVVTVTLLVFGDELDPHRDDAVALAEIAAEGI